MTHGANYLPFRPFGVPIGCKYGDLCTEAMSGSLDKIYSKLDFLEDEFSDQAKLIPNAASSYIKKKGDNLSHPFLYAVFSGFTSLELRM